MQREAPFWMDGINIFQSNIFKGGTCLGKSKTVDRLLYIGHQRWFCNAQSLPASFSRDAQIGSPRAPKLVLCEAGQARSATDQPDCIQKEVSAAAEKTPNACLDSRAGELQSCKRRMQNLSSAWLRQELQNNYLWVLRIGLVFNMTTERKTELINSRRTATIMHHAAHCQQPSTQYSTQPIFSLLPHLTWHHDCDLISPVSVIRIIRPTKRLN